MIGFPSKFRSISGEHICFIRGPNKQSLQNQRKSKFSSSSTRENSKFINLFDEKDFYIDILRNLPRLITLTTNNSSAQFNARLLKDSSSVISEFLTENPNNMEYHLDVDDKYNIINKFEKLYLGDIVTFDDDELPISKKITGILNMSCFPNYMKPESLKSEENANRNLGLEDGVGIHRLYFERYISQSQHQTFKIITNNKEYGCNYYGVFSSKVILDLIKKDPTTNQYEYDFCDENKEFQPIQNYFNFQNIEITLNNMDFLKDIAEDLQIDSILPKIDKYLNDYEKFSKTIDEQQNIVDSI